MVVSFNTSKHPLSSSPGLTLQNTSTGSFTMSSLLTCLLAGVLPVRALMGVLIGPRGVLVPKPAVRLGVFVLLGFISHVITVLITRLDLSAIIKSNFILFL